jgi:alcohol dehydrogenase (NADP+)
MATFALNNGLTIPAVGLGTWNSIKEGEVKAAVISAIAAGYRHIDCAWIYKNEKEVGEAFTEIFSAGEVKREDFFITSKLWNTFHAKEDVEKACRQSLQDLQVDILDLYLIHWPVTNFVAEVLTPEIKETWLAMEELVTKGLVRSIGVSNFSAKKLEAMKEYATIFPAVNQVELHPQWRQDDLLRACAEMGVHVTAYSPLGSGGNSEMLGYTGLSVLENPVILDIATAVNKSPAQVCIRWAVQRGTSVVPKSSTASRIAQNFDVFSWELSAVQFRALNTIEPQQRILAGHVWVNTNGPYKSVSQLWDE